MANARDIRQQAEYTSGYHLDGEQEPYKRANLLTKDVERISGEKMQAPYRHTSAHRHGQRPPKGLGTNKTVKATRRSSMHVNMKGICPGSKISSTSSQTGIVDGYGTKMPLSCLLQTYCCSSTDGKCQLADSSRTPTV